MHAPGPGADAVGTAAPVAVTVPALYGMRSMLGVVLRPSFPRGTTDSSTVGRRLTGPGSLLDLVRARVDGLN